MSKNDTIIILDFGSQYTQLIARRVREVGVFSVILPCDIDIDRIKLLNPRGIILSGGPSSVYSDNAPIMDKSIFDLDIPILGICGGEQLINVCLGGTLIQDINQLESKTLEHEQTKPRNLTSHKVLIKHQTILHQIIGEDEIEVNSAHHQAIDKLGEGLRISGKSIDGIIESIESINHKWCVGVQWHPEFLITKADKKIISNFIKFSKL